MHSRKLRVSFRIHIWGLEDRNFLEEKKEKRLNLLLWSRNLRKTSKCILHKAWYMHASDGFLSEFIYSMLYSGRARE